MLKSIFRAQIITLFGLLGLWLSACTPQAGSDRWFRETSPDEIRMHYAYNCQSYGFRDGSAEFAECIQKEINDQKQRNTISQSAAASANATGTIFGGSGKSGVTLVLRETFK